MMMTIPRYGGSLSPSVCLLRGSVAAVISTGTDFREGERGDAGGGAGSADRECESLWLFHAGPQNRGEEARSAEGTDCMGA